MKHLIKVLLVGICILLIATPSSPAKDSPVKSAAYQASPSSVFDITYAVFVWTPVSTLFRPRYIDQFEFKAGDVFSAYTSRYGELTGTWIESDIGNGTWFQAWVEKEETSTTTTTPSTTTSAITANASRIQLSDKLNYDINIWGVSSSFTPPEPFDIFTYSTIFGYGAYLGADAFFLGFARIPGPDEEPSFGSISPAEGEQEQSLDVTITGVNTTFQDDGPVDIAFVPNDNNEITITNVSTISNTEIECNIEISSTATPGFRTVVVTYDDGSKVVTGTNKFEVKQKGT